MQPNICANCKPLFSIQKSALLMNPSVVAPEIDSGLILSQDSLIRCFRYCPLTFGSLRYLYQKQTIELQSDKQADHKTIFYPSV